MSDLYCAKCGEPWDAWGVNDGDMTRKESARFKRGEGCPACEFGTVCTNCHGTGTEDNGCRTCIGSGRVIVRKLAQSTSPRTDQYTKWFIRIAGDIRADVDEPYKRLPNEQSADGVVFVGWSWCPDCHNDGPTCHACGGDGTFQEAEGEDAIGLETTALSALIENTDEDPTNYLFNWAF